MNLATVLYQTPVPIPKGAGRLVTQKRPEDDITEYPVKTDRVCTGCGAKEDGTNFYRLGTRCKQCQKVTRCLRK